MGQAVESATGQSGSASAALPSHGVDSNYGMAWQAKAKRQQQRGTTARRSTVGLANSGTVSAPGVVASALARLLLPWASDNSKS